MSIVGNGPPIRLDGVEFDPVTARPSISNYEFHFGLGRWVRRHRLGRGDVVDVQRPDFLRPFVGTSELVGLVCTLHGDPYFAIRQRRSFGAVLYRRAEEAALVATHRVISVSESSLAKYVTRLPFLRSKATVISVGVDGRTFKPMDTRLARERLGLEDRPTLMYGGRLEPEKRVGVLLDAVETLSDPPMILIAGGGRDERVIRARARKNVRLLGTVDHAFMPNVLAASDAVVLMSAFEGLPTLAVEALSCGVPVVSTPVGDLPRIIEPGKTGFLFDGSPESLRRIVEHHLEDMRELRDQCVRAAQPFHWENVSRKVAEVLTLAAS